MKIPITLAVTNPVNVNVREYDANSILMALNGQGEIEICVETGDFMVEPGVNYCITGDGVQRVAATEDGVLSVPLMLDGPVTLLIRRDG